jgi:hypothetical protein
LEELVVSRIARKHVSQRLGVLFCFLLPFLEPPQRVRRVLIARLLLDAAHQIRLLVQRSNRRPHIVRSRTSACSASMLSMENAGPTRHR